MKIATAVFIVTLFASTAPLAATTEDPKLAAESAAIEWLTLLDAGHYTESWSAASTLFRDRLSQSRWTAKAETGRGYLGELLSRKLRSEQSARTVSGEPDGEYFLVNFTSNFAWTNGQRVIETVAMRDEGGVWRVVDYYIADATCAVDTVCLQR